MTKRLLINNRQFSLGGTDIGVIAGVNPFKSEKDLYFEKIGEQAVEIQDNINMKLGRYLEPMLLDYYIEKNGVALETRKTKCFKLHPQYEFLSSNIDGLTSDGKVIVEAKTTGDISKWKGGIPEYYKTQVAHYANIWDVERVDFVVFDKSTQEFYNFTYERDKEYEKQLEKMAIDWWTRYIINKEPFSTLSIQRKNDVAEALQVDTTDIIKGSKVVLNTNKELLKCKTKIITVKSLKETINILEAKLKHNEQFLKDLIGEHEYLVDDQGNELFSYKICKRKGSFDTTNFKEKYSELYLQFQKEDTPYRRLTINN